MDELERGEPSPQRHDGESFPDGGREPSSDGITSSPESDGDGTPENSNEASDPGSQVMGRLPRTRPQRRSERRPAGAAKTGSPAPKRKAATTRGQRSASGARSSASATARRRSTGAQATGQRTAETATRVAARKRAPGMPQLTVDAILGAAKFPLKVTASVTRHATQLIGRGLRLR